MATQAAAIGELVTRCAASPAPGSDPEIRDALGRYALLTFCQGADLGPEQVVRHKRGQVSVHELARARPPQNAMIQA